MTERSTALALRLARSAVRRARDLLPRRPAPSILLYHHIAEESFDPWGLAVAPKNFEAQVEWLQRNRTVFPLTEFAQLHREGRLPVDAVAITFDDGYGSVLEVAAPVLSRAGAPATVFLSAELIERGGEFWWDELQNIALVPMPHSFDSAMTRCRLGRGASAIFVGPPELQRERRGNGPSCNSGRGSRS
jgi:peptidoglycan/xylan/chitin deacetylase (PgdA/CDA1 family)